MKKIVVAIPHSHTWFLDAGLCRMSQAQPTAGRWVRRQGRRSEQQSVVSSYLRVDGHRAG